MYKYNLNDIEKLKQNNCFIYLTPLELLNYNNPSDSYKKYKNVYCVNCGEKGHLVKTCDGPITSFGIIAYKIVNNKQDETNDLNNNLRKFLKMNNNCKNLYIPPHKYIPDIQPQEEYPKIKLLMIQRKDTMGFTDLIRGKYPDDYEQAEEILLIFLNEMTVSEKMQLMHRTFDEIWSNLWVNHESKCFKNEYDYASKKYSKLNINKLLEKSQTSYYHTELGFAKGRRNMREKNIECSQREFFEETGYKPETYDFVQNYPTIVEEFVGTNNVKYRHIYYLVKMKDNVPPPTIDANNIIQTGEVQNIGWFSLEESLSLIRPYDVEKKNVIRQVHNDILYIDDTLTYTKPKIHNYYKKS